MGRACLVEGLGGAALGWSAALIVAGARQAGELVGLQAGLSPAALLDPEAAEELTPLGHLYGLVALAVFLALDGPLAPILCASVTAYRPCVDCLDPQACALRLLMGDVRDAMSDVVDHRSLEQLASETRRLRRKKPRTNAPKTGRSTATSP